MVSIPQQDLTITAWQLPPCRDGAKEYQSRSVLSPPEQTHPIRVQATGRTVWKGTCWCCWQYPCLYLVEAPSAGIFTQALSCVARKLRADEKKKLLWPQAAKFWIMLLRDGEGQAIPCLFVHRDHSLYVFYYFDLFSFKHSSSGGLANCHKRLFCRGILLFLRNSISMCCWVFQFKHIYYSPNQNIWLL